MPAKGHKMSEEMKKHLSLVHTKNRKCSVDGCDKPHMAKGFCKNHWQKHRRETDPMWKDKKNKKQLQAYYDNHEERKLKKRITGKSERAELYRKLGSKCVSCGEKYDPDLARSNMEIHHKEYSAEDMAVKEKFKGNIGSRHIWEVKRMLKTGINPKKKFCLLCAQCNTLEAFVRINKTKAFETFCWLAGEGYFDNALKADPKLKKLSEFMK